LKRILVTGAGGSPATNFVRSLRRAEPPVHLVGTDADKYLLMRAETDARHLVPPVRDPRYLDVLNEIVAEERIDFVHVQNDVELGFLSARRDELTARTFLPARETVGLCQDKYASFERWRAAGLKVPETTRITSDADLAAALERFGGQMWLRAITGAAGRGSLPVHDLDTARRWLDLQDGWGGDFTAAELLEPDSVTWMSLWHEGELIVAQSRRRLYWELGRLAPSGVTGITGAGMTIRDGALDAIALRAIRAIDSAPHGLFGVDLALDRDGVPNPTEINIGRFFTTHLFFAALGLNMPELYIRLGLGEAVAPVEPRINPLPEGMVWIRGVDFEPVLVATGEIEAHAARLERRLGRVAV
jgi:hypothetical protein